MTKKSNTEVRDHSSEREWLRNLGKGNIFEGVQSLILETQKKKTDKKNTGRCLPHKFSPDIFFQAS